MRRAPFIAAALVVAIVITLTIARRASSPEGEAQPADPVAAEEPSPAPVLSAEEEPDFFQPPDVATRPPLAEPDAPPTPWALVDLDAAREALPDNLYWELAAPTSDPRLLGDREREKTLRNEQYGKILSGTGSDEEIQAYYEHRQRLSSDYVRFIDWVLERNGDDLGEQDLELLHVARRMHMARLREIPKRMQEAFERKREQDAAREAWLADETAFNSGEAADGEIEPEAPPDRP